MVGTFGNSPRRIVEVTASGRSFPALMNARAEVVATNITCTCPESRRIAAIASHSAGVMPDLRLMPASSKRERGFAYIMDQAMLQHLSRSHGCAAVDHVAHPDTTHSK
jgi:hypothetical protein